MEIGECLPNHGEKSPGIGIFPDFATFDKKVGT